MYQEWFKEYQKIKESIKKSIYKGEKSKMSKDKEKVNKKELIKTIDFAVKATGNSDDYCTGMCNGMIYIKSLLDNKEPKYLSCPKKKEEK